MIEFLFIIMWVTSGLLGLLSLHNVKQDSFSDFINSDLAIVQCILSSFGGFIVLLVALIMRTKLFK